MKLIAPNHIITIGASAGGMEEINLFFDHTPVDGVSYVIIQHLSPSFKSRMVELIAKHSKLLVKEAANKMLLLCNEVYLIPNDKFMTISKGRFYLTDKETHPIPHLTINTFFASLAIDAGEKAIAIILSGLGSDGTEGARLIKAEGGTVIARDPATTSFSSMPASAIASGCVDIILEPALMPQAIEDIVRSKAALFPVDDNEEKEVEEIKAIIKEQLPFDFSDYKQATLLRRIKRRAAHYDLSTLKNYISLLNTDAEEVKVLAQDFLISVTSFFRDKEAFEIIAKKVIPVIIKKLEPGEEIKVWVAGCATGEEAYSLGILIHEGLAKAKRTAVVKIFATDIDSIALAAASKGIFSNGIEKDLSPARLEKYFTKEGNGYKIKNEIRSMLVFAQHDLVKNPPYCNMHMICCRNVLIYITPPMQKKIYLMLLFGLRKNGYLFLGNSENPVSILQHLEVLDKKWKLYRNNETKRSIYFDGFSLPQMADIKERAVPVSRADSDHNIYHTLTDAVNHALVNEAGQLAVCIDEHNSVVRTYGDTSKFLLQKNFTASISALLPKPIIAPFYTSVNSVRKNNKSVSLTGIEIKHEGQVIRVNFSVSPLLVKNLETKLILLLFSEEKADAVSAEAAAAFDERSYQDEYGLIMEQELNELKDKLQATYAQLDASNDNMQSYNEELLSANEEMQSTNEEMQSVNEELYTINTDYQLKNKELLELNDDLNNYFRSNINGQLFVNKELKLVKFSPGAVKLINLLPTDVGRPLSNISTNIKFETFTEDINAVLRNGEIITKEIETDTGSWYQVMTMPYIKQADNTINGVILTFNDITALKRMQFELDKKNQSLERINEDLDSFVHIASHDLLAPLGNIELSIAVMNQVNVVDPELNNFLTIINNSAKRFRMLINEIATVARIEKDMTAIEMVDMQDLIKDVEWSLDDKIKESGAVINTKLEVKAIPFSKRNLRSILFNLVSNAIKFRGSNAPIISIDTTKNAKDLFLSVKDNGMGMTTEHANKIFEMYSRLNPELEGQGIWLYLVKKIVNAASGTINVETGPGKGSTFTLKFDSIL